MNKLLMPCFELTVFFNTLIFLSQENWLLYCDFFFSGSLLVLGALFTEKPQERSQIPRQLIRNVLQWSRNHLTWPIPRGQQFTTFTNAYFDGNPGLCGSPLSTPSSSKKGSTSEFDWKFALVDGIWK